MSRNHETDAQTETRPSPVFEPRAASAHPEPRRPVDLDSNEPAPPAPPQPRPSKDSGSGFGSFG